MRNTRLWAGKDVGEPALKTMTCRWSVQGCSVSLVPRDGSGVRTEAKGEKPAQTQQQSDQQAARCGGGAVGLTVCVTTHNGLTINTRTGPGQHILCKPGGLGLTLDRPSCGRN